MRVLLVEDDTELQGQLRRLLERAGYQVCVAGDGVEGHFYSSEFRVDIAIIDLGLPKVDGIELVQRLRSEGYDFPILILTARSGWKGKVQGLDAGADDYVTKPFQSEELMARMTALLRRAAGHAHSQLTRGPISLDLKTKSVFVDGCEVDLTAFEYKILEHFMMHPKTVTSKAMLVDCLYSEDDDKDSNVVEVIIARLRKKLDPNGRYKPIETLRGRGYRFIGALE